MCGSDLRRLRSRLAAVRGASKRGGAQGHHLRPTDAMPRSDNQARTRMPCRMVEVAGGDPASGPSA
eukprot:4651525-Pyramimonas_sp.AAC.1